MINYADIGTEQIDYVVDRNVHKHGRYMPGKHLPVWGPERHLADRPDYVLILASNFADEIIDQLDRYRRGGGRFIVPIPVVHIR